ncbi:Gp37-like protein [Promicromonospora sukumoe]
MATALEQACADGLAAVRAREASLEAFRLIAPVIKLWDGNIGLQHVVRCENEYDWLDNENDTGKGTIKVDTDYEEGQYLWDIKGRRDRGETIDVLVTVDYVGRRWSGFLDEVTIDTNDLGQTIVTADFLSDYEQLKWRHLWATPSTPAGFQPFKTFMLGGPTDWSLGTALKLNLARAHGRPSGMGWMDPLADGAADYREWPIVLAPLDYETAATRGTVTGLVLSRFKTWHEAAEAMLDDADITVRWRRYMPGDALPWPGAQVSYGTLVVWFENNSGGLTSNTTGSFFGGIAQLVRIFVSSAVEGLGGGSLPIDNSEEAIVGIPSVPEYQVPGYLGTEPKGTYVFYPAGSPGVVMQKAKVKLARGRRLTGGGHSMPMVNELISAAVQAIGDALAAIPLAPIPPLGGVADALLAPFYEDTILAFMTVYLVNRAAYLSHFSLYEMWVDGADQAYTLSATLVLREVVRATETKYSADMEIIDGAPWYVGAKGYGHFDLGNRIFVQTEGDRSGRIESPRVKSLRLSAAVGKAPGFGIKLGSKDPVDAFGRVIKRIQKLASGLKAMGMI